VIPNIGPRGQAQRRTFGYITLGVAALVLMLLFMLHAPRAWRAVTVLPLWLSALGFFQAKDKT
jgi:hypothetical protein